MSGEDIQERTFRFGCRIVRLHQFLMKRDSATRSLATQLLRAGTSIGANLAEAHFGASRNDFIHKCNIALKEARETQYGLRLFSACQLVPAGRVSPLIAEITEINAILATILKRSRRIA